LRKIVETVKKIKQTSKRH